MSDPAVRPIQLRPPTTFRWPAVLVFSGYGFLLLLPAIFAMLMVSTLPFTYWTYIIPLIALAFATLFLPFGFGNGYAGRMAARYKPGLNTAARSEPMLVQVTFVPRLRSGVRSLLDDADDIGWVSWDSSSLHFQGDSVSFSFPLAAVSALRFQNSGIRGLFLYNRICLQINAPEMPSEFWLAERSSLLLPASRMSARRMFKQLSQAVAAVQSNNNPTTPKTGQI